MRNSRKETGVPGPTVGVKDNNFGVNEKLDVGWMKFLEF